MIFHKENKEDKENKENKEEQGVTIIEEIDSNSYKNLNQNKENMGSGELLNLKSNRAIIPEEMSNNNTKKTSKRKLQKLQELKELQDERREGDDLKEVFLNLRHKFENRRDYNVTSGDICKLNCYHSKYFSNKEKVILNAIKYIENSSEISNLVSLTRYDELNNELILNKQQRKIIKLASINVNKKFKVKEEEEDEDKEEGKYSLRNISEEDFIDILSNLDYCDKKNYKLVRNIIKSII